MSYILDALRKSEQERQVATGQAASALYPVMLDAKSPRISWLQLLAAGGAVVVVAGLAFWWLSSQQPTAPAAAIGNPAPVPPATMPKVEPPVIVPPPVVLAPVEPPVQEIAPPAPIAPVLLDKPRSAPAVAVKPRTATAAVAPEKAARLATKPDDSPVLPESMQKELPPMHIAGYIRDYDGGGMAMINDRLVREGEEVSPGLRLEKILPDGAIFSFKGRRFSR